MNIPMSETEHTILRARMVLPMQGPPIEDGAVVVREGRILSVGRWAELESPPAGQVRDLGEQVLLPGLINAHCHLDYSCMKGRVPYAHSFIEWILALVQLKAATTDGEYLEGFKGGLAELLGAGTTTVLNVGAFPRFVDRIDNPGLRLLWCFELLDFNQPESAETQLQNVEAFIDAHPTRNAQATTATDVALRAHLMGRHLASTTSARNRSPGRTAPAVCPRP